MKVEPSAHTPDWSRERPNSLWDPSRRLLRTLRKYQSWVERKGLVARLMRKFWTLQHHFWSVVTGADIPLQCQIEGGLLLPHPNGIVIHPETRIGPNCLIFQQVTLGIREGHGVPVIRGHVDIGAGARVLGGVTIGEDSRIGANAVVLSSFPASSIIVGIPAKRIGDVTESAANDPPESQAILAQN